MLSNVPPVMDLVLTANLFMTDIKEKAVAIIIIRKEFTFPSVSGGAEIYGCVWLSDGTKQYKGIVHLVHGMAEHILRYQQFAIFLAQQGFLVCGNDHLGHGRSIAEPEDFGFFGKEEENYGFLIGDMRYLMNFIKKHFGANLPYFIIGHSMGSFLAREFTTLYGNELTGSVFLGTSGGNPFLDTAILLSKKGINRKGPKQKAYSVNRLAFGGLNVRFTPSRTAFDWISSLPESVNQFITDPLCGFVITYAGYHDLFCLLKRISSKEWADRLPKDLPMLLISGADDPIGDYGKGVEHVYVWMQEAGCTNTSIKLYPDARHELLHEACSRKVERFLLRWLHEILEETETTYKISKEG